MQTFLFDQTKEEFRRVSCVSIAALAIQHTNSPDPSQIGNMLKNKFENIISKKTLLTREL